jgi:hypothetical protein
VIDLIGYPMNLTKKIQSNAGHDEILIGRQLYELIHIVGKNIVKRQILAKNGKMKDPQHGTAIYEVYSCKVKWVCNCSM